MSLRGLVMMWLVVATVVAVHEFAQGLTCRHFGGKVQSMGFMLIYLSPAFYCDVSEAWMFPTRRERMWVTFAGGYIQLVVWGLAMIGWRVLGACAVGRFSARRITRDGDRSVSVTGEWAFWTPRRRWVRHGCLNRPSFGLICGRYPCHQAA